MSGGAIIAVTALMIANGVMCLAACLVNRATLRELLRQGDLLQVSNRRRASRVGEEPLCPKCGKEAPHVLVPGVVCAPCAFAEKDAARKRGER